MNQLLKDIIYILLVFALIYIMFYLGTRHNTLEEKMARYDCSLSEFVPDVPPEVRAECRRRAIERINQQQGQ
jgi:hypothetical protein